MKLGIVGATGAVGRMMLQVMLDMRLSVNQIRLFASERSQGSIILFGHKELVVERLSEKALSEPFDYLLFSAGAELARHFAPIAARFTPMVIDNSSAFRNDPQIPLVVPEINGHRLSGYHGIVANPNCSTIQMVLGLHPIHIRWGIEEIVVTTFQSVSGAGNKGIQELRAQQNGEKRVSHFPEQIHENVIPMIGNLDSTGYSTEEHKMVFETRKILEDPDIRIYPTCVRVPVQNSHSESIFIRTRIPFDSDQLIKALATSPCIRLTDELITPLKASGTDTALVSRLRVVGDREALLWNVADNLRVGAATNALRIIQTMQIGPRDA